MVQQEIDWSLPDAKTIQHHIDETVKLLKELHESMSWPLIEELRDAFESGKMANPFEKGSNLREPIFYGGESAYSFQFRDLSVQKYRADAPWLEKQMGFTIQFARDVVHALVKLQNGKFTSIQASFPDQSPNEWTFLPCFVFTTDELADASGMDREQVERVVNAFALPDGERNLSFRVIDDFSVVSAMPIIPIGDGRLFMLEQYSLEQSLYESPFFGCVMICPIAKPRFATEASLLRIFPRFGSKQSSGSEQFSKMSRLPGPRGKMRARSTG
jgi:hypothetical protein